ncbi:MAG: hypothetical protein KBT20_07855 [Bacteroidales bacterium]|nr:hypothetical protein [Candidatus Liminaster caballi]
MKKIFTLFAACLVLAASAALTSCRSSISDEDVKNAIIEESKSINKTAGSLDYSNGVGVGIWNVSLQEKSWVYTILVEIDMSKVDEESQMEIRTAFKNGASTAVDAISESMKDATFVKSTPAKLFFEAMDEHGYDILYRYIDVKQEEIASVRIPVSMILERI